MIGTPEFKQYFVTHWSNPLLPIEPAESPIVNETTLARFKVVDGITIGLVFLEDNEPSADIYTKLLESIPFKLNTSDRARTSDDPKSYYQGVNGNLPIGGLVQMATNQQAKAQDNGVTTQISRTVFPSQLPSVIGGDSGTKSFDITGIANTPIKWLAVTPSPLVTTHNEYGVALSSFGLDWLEQALNTVKGYVDTVTVNQGTVTISPSGLSAIEVAKQVATGTHTNQYTVSVLIGVDNDPFLTNNAPNVIPSQQAVKGYVDDSISNVNSKADQADLITLQGRVATMEGSTPVLKATQADLLTLATRIDTKVSKITNDTVEGVITFNHNPRVPSGALGTQAINEADVLTKLTNYYTKVEVDDLLNIERLRTTVLEGQIVTLQNQIVNLQDTLSSYLTKSLADTLYSPIAHNHNTTYHPLVEAALTMTGDLSFQRLSLASVQKGIIVSHAT